MNLMKQEIKTSEVVCQKYHQTMIESDVIVPDVKPDIKKILDVSGVLCVTQKSIQQDKIFIEGTLKMTVLYLPDHNEGSLIRSLTTNQEFNHTMDCRGAAPDLQLSVEATPEHLDHTLLNSRKLKLRCTAGLNAKVIRPLTLSLTTGMEDNQSIALKRERLRLVSSMDSCESRIMLREQLDLPGGNPAIREILKLSATPTGLETRLMDGKAVVKGQVRIATLYISEPEQALQCTEHTLPFTEILDANCSEGMEGDTDYTLQDLYFEVREDNDGEARILSIELVLGVTVRGYELTQIDAVTDAYALKGGLDLTSKAYQLEQLLDHRTAELTHKDQAQLPPMLPKLKQVCDVNADARIDRISVEGEQITVFGSVHTAILYLTEDEAMPVAGFHHVSEFSHSFSAVGAGADTACDAQVFLNHCSYTLSGGDSLELRFILGLSVKAFSTGSILLIDDMKPFLPEKEPSCPSMVLYFVQKDDSLWEIAKSHHTTVEAIKELNHLDGDTIYPGQQLKLTARWAC